jgi:excinuclease ABC subunit C
MLSEKLSSKLKTLPKTPGVYFHKDKNGQIIYVGKAAVLHNRVRQYFQVSRNRDPKTVALVAEIVDTDWMEVGSELEALFLEAEMIKRYKPRFNILERDDKSDVYIRIDPKSINPTVTTLRQPADDGAMYYGPYLSGYAVKRALKLLRKIFPYSTHIQLPSRACLLVHIGLCPGPETEYFDIETYRENLKLLSQYLSGDKSNLIKAFEKKMTMAAVDENFELAAKYRNKLYALKSLSRAIIFSDKEFMDVEKDHALNELQDLLSLDQLPKRIEGYDISHMSGTDVVASMVVSTNGISDKGAYRKFKMKVDQNNDFFNMHEVIFRRFSDKNIKAWGLPKLILIDGGKGQLGAAIEALIERGIDIPAIGLAKEFEQIVIKKPLVSMSDFVDESRGSNLIFSKIELTKQSGVIVENSQDFVVIQLPKNSHVSKYLQRIRDESHRFAVSYHTSLKRKRQIASTLDEVPTIGPKTKKLLLTTFGSIRGIQQARKLELEKLVGINKTTILRQYLGKN